MRWSPIFAAVVLLSLSSCDVVRSRYATLDDARRDRLFERGWLPDILPPSSHSIRVSSDLDTNHSTGEFSFDPADFAAFSARLRAQVITPSITPQTATGGSFLAIHAVDIADTPRDDQNMKTPPLQTTLAAARGD